MIRSIAAASAIALASLAPLVTAHAHTSGTGTGTVYNTQQCLDAKVSVARVQAALRDEAAQIAEHNPGSLSTTAAKNQAARDASIAASAILSVVAGQTGC